MRQWLIFKIGYVCQIPQEEGGRAYLANSLQDTGANIQIIKPVRSPGQDCVSALTGIQDSVLEHTWLI